MNPVSYKGFAITARTFQIRGSGRWTLDLLIGRRGDLRAFSAPITYSTELGPSRVVVTADGASSMGKCRIAQLMICRETEA
jgi:hypothetical protein